MEDEDTTVVEDIALEAVGEADETTADEELVAEFSTSDVADFTTVVVTVAVDAALVVVFVEVTVVAGIDTVAAAEVVVTVAVEV
jgi:hypothetical protein